MVVHVSVFAVAGGNQAILINLFDVFEPVVEVREAEGDAIHVAADSSVMNQINRCSFPS